MLFYENKTAMKIRINWLGYLLAIIPFVVTPFWYYSFITGRVVLWCVAILLAIYFLWQEKISAKVFITDPRLSWLGIFVLWLTVRAIFGGEIGAAWWGSWIRSDGLFLLWGMLPILAAVLYAHKKNNYVSAVYLGVLIFGALISRLFVLAPGSELLVTDSRWAGSVGNALFFGTVILFVPFFAQIAFEKTKQSRVYLSCMAAVTLFLLYATGSRGTMLAAAVGACYVGAHWVFNHYTSWQKRIGLSVGALVLFIFLAYGLGGRALHISMQDETVQSRATLYKNALHEFAARPLVGYGPVGFHDIIVRDLGNLDEITNSEQVFDSTHSWYFDLLLAGGVVGLLLYGFWAWFVFRSLSTIGRATFVAYHVALATAPFQMWAVPALVLLVSMGKKTELPNLALNKNLQKVFQVGGLVLGVSAVIMIIGITSEVWHMQDALSVTQTLGTVSRAAGQTPMLFPYTQERDVIYSQRLVTLLQAQIISSFELQPLSESYVPRLEGYMQSQKIPTTKLHNVAVFFQMYAPNAPDHTVSYWEALAETGYRAVLARAPGRPATSVALAGLLSSQGQEKAAGEVLTNFLALYPNSPTANFYWAVHLDASGDHAGAVTYATRAFQLRPDGWSTEQLNWYAQLKK